MKKEKSDSSQIKWFITIFFTTFILSILFSFISTTAITDLDLIPAVIILITVIFIGILFDIIAVAVTVGKESDFHAKASKKIKGAKTSINLIRNSAKVANICADVIGDIAGVLSGAISTMISATNYDERFLSLIANLCGGAVNAEIRYSIMSADASRNPASSLTSET